MMCDVMMCDVMKCDVIMSDVIMSDVIMSEIDVSALLLCMRADGLTDLGVTMSLRDNTNARDRPRLTCRVLAQPYSKSHELHVLYKD